jgi:hypothetical protein
VGAFRFRLCLEDGSDIGPFETVVADWATGDELYDAERRCLFRILEVVRGGAAPAGYDAGLVVRRVELGVFD